VNEIAQRADEIICAIASGDRQGCRAAFIRLVSGLGSDPSPFIDDPGIPQEIIVLYTLAIYIRYKESGR
jgi:hypothetical protein